MAMTVVAWLAVAAGSLTQTASGFGFALVCSPVLVAVLGSGPAVRTVITLSCLVSALILARTWRHARLRDALVLGVCGALLTAPIAAVVHRLDARVLTAAAGLVTVGAAALMARQGVRVPLRGAAGVCAVGIVSAAMNALGGLSGPAGALYAANERWPRQAVAPTLQVFGLLLNAASLTALGGPRLDWRFLPALPVGWLLGALVADRLPAHRFRQVVLGVAAVGGAAAVARAALG